MHSNHTPSPPLQAIFEGAKRFGLTEDEAWRAIDDSLDEVGGDATVSEYLDALAGTMAHRILIKQRHTAAQTQPGAPEERRITSQEPL
jgi:hypothetical protein